MLRVKVKKGLFFAAPNIEVMLHKGETLVSKTMTDKSGLAFFMHLDPGDYKVVITSPKPSEQQIKIEKDMTVCSLRI